MTGLLKELWNEIFKICFRKRWCKKHHVIPNNLVVFSYLYDGDSGTANGKGILTGETKPPRKGTND